MARKEESEPYEITSSGRIAIFSVFIALIRFLNHFMMRNEEFERETTSLCTKFRLCSKSYTHLDQYLRHTCLHLVINKS